MKLFTDTEVQLESSIILGAETSHLAQAPENASNFNASYAGFTAGPPRRIHFQVEDPLSLCQPEWKSFLEAEWIRAQEDKNNSPP